MNILKCRECDAESTTLSEDKLCWKCFGDTTKDIGNKCDGTKRKLCKNKKCNHCYKKSIASLEEAIYWSNENEDTPRDVFINGRQARHFVCWKCQGSFEVNVHDIEGKKTICYSDECKDASLDVKIDLSKLKKAPADKKKRKVDKMYILNCEARIWKGKSWNCIHDRQKSMCHKCNDASSPLNKRRGIIKRIRDENPDESNLGIVKLICAEYDAELVEYEDDLEAQYKKITIQCNYSHTKFTMRVSTLYEGYWCKKCATELRKTDIREYQKCAEARGGKLLTTEEEYKKDNHTSGSLMEWECQLGHKWKATGGCIKNAGQWCPKCNSSRFETVCRTILEHIFNPEKFINIRPEFLKRENGRRLELDLYNETLGFAVEVNGSQHYKEKQFGGHKTNLEEIQERDNEKKQMCENNDVKFLTIPYTVKMKDMYTFIISLLQEHDIHIPEHEPIDPLSINASPDCVNYYNKLVARVTEKGGKVLSEVYINNDSDMNFECAKGHEFISTYHGVMGGKRWCKKCGDDGKKLTIEEINKILKKQKIVCLKYEHSTIKARFKHNDHEFSDTFTRLKSRIDNNHSICPVCNENKPYEYIKELNKLLEGTNIECIENRYTSATRSMHFFHNDHMFESTINDLRTRNTRGIYLCTTCKIKCKKILIPSYQRMKGANHKKQPHKTIKTKKLQNSNTSDDDESKESYNDESNKSCDDESNKSCDDESKESYDDESNKSCDDESNKSCDDESNKSCDDESKESRDDESNKSCDDESNKTCDNESKESCDDESRDNKSKKSREGRTKNKTKKHHKKETLTKLKKVIQIDTDSNSDNNTSDND